MIWIGLIGVIGYFGYRFFSDLGKDNIDLRNISVSNKFDILVDLINKTAFNGNGQVVPLDKRSFEIYEDGQNQIIGFFYSTGNLLIVWQYNIIKKRLSIKNFL